VIALDDLSDQFWTWRTANQPDSYDDITRVARPAGWISDWSRAAIEARRQVLRGFAAQFAALDLTGRPVQVQVNGRLLGSALSRAHWELELLRSWERDPRFYVDQSLVPLYNVLLRPQPFAQDFFSSVMAHLRQVPRVLAQARDNLTASAEFASGAAQFLDGMSDRLAEAMTALALLLPDEQARELPKHTKQACAALAGFRQWLVDGTGTFDGAAAVGADAFSFYLHQVALLPYDTARLQAMSAQEWNRAVAAEVIARRRAQASPQVPQPADLSEQVAAQQAAEAAVRQFYLEHDLLSQPEELRHYRFAATPPYVLPLTQLGVPHYTGSIDRPCDDAVHYAPPLRDDLPYFASAEVRDSRAAILHEGVHAQQMALSWTHPDPARRRFYDSTANEGLAFYNEELMLMSGLLDDAPGTAHFVASAMRLRALRVDIDISLACGTRTVKEAADLLAAAVPMDDDTAWQEATFFAGNPGQGLSYQIGKLQILELLTAAQSHPGFTLRKFHDRLWREGNIPLVLQRWELLGNQDQLDEADRLARQAEAE
jgi:uncharacterized protein DUF885